MENNVTSQNRRRQDDEIEIDIWEICLLLLHHLGLIISTGIMTALCAFLFTQLFINPTYQSTTKIYIINKEENSNLTYSDVQLGTQLTKDYAELIRSRFVLEEVINTMNLRTSYEALAGQVSVSTPADTRVQSITVTDADPVKAMQIANAVREVASEHIMNVMDTQAVNVVETANMPVFKSSPSASKNTMLGGMVGVLVVAAFVLIRYLTDDTIKTTEDVERYLQLSVLATIPLSEGESASKKKRKKVRRGVFGR